MDVFMVPVGLTINLPRQPPRLAANILERRFEIYSTRRVLRAIKNARPRL